MGSDDDLDAFSKNLDKVFFGLKIIFFSLMAAGAIFISHRLYLTVHGYDPHYGKKVEIEDLKTVLESDERPAVVFFHTEKNSKDARVLLPIMDHFAKRYAGIAFYYSQLKMQSCSLSKEEASKDYRGYGGVMVFKNGKEVGRSMQYFRTPEENKAMVYMLFKNFLKLKSQGAPASWGIRKFTPSSFEMLQSISTRPIFLNFSSALCGACMSFKPHYEAIAAKYSGVADFYYLERENAKDLPFFKKYKARSYPTLVLIQNEKVRAKFTGAYGDLYLNEVRVVGAMLPYLESSDEKPLVAS